MLKKLVSRGGIEPPTRRSHSSLLEGGQPPPTAASDGLPPPNRRGNFPLHPPRASGSRVPVQKAGEPWRNRTSDPLIKSQLLCQLS